MILKYYDQCNFFFFNMLNFIKQTNKKDNIMILLVCLNRLS